MKKNYNSGSVDLELVEARGGKNRKCTKISSQKLAYIPGSRKSEKKITASTAPNVRLNESGRETMPPAGQNGHRRCE